MPIPRRETSPAAPKSCAVCGRQITPRKKWKRDWARVRYCSDACRRAGRSRSRRELGERLEAEILRLLAERDPAATGEKTICPGEAARAVAAPDGRSAGSGEGDQDAWRELMEPARQAGRRLAARGLVSFVQGGRVIDVSTAKGPVRLRLLAK